MLFSEKIKLQIEEFAKDLMDNNKFFIACYNDKVDKFPLGIYLRNLEEMIAITPSCLEKASESSEGKMSDHFFEKIAEETGHDEWARQDIKKLGLESKDLNNWILPTMQNHMDMLKYFSSKEPLTYLCYTTVAEYLTVLAGPALVRALNSNSKIPIDSSTVISKHIELDVNHVDEEVKVLDQYVTEKDHDYLLYRTQMFCQNIYRFLSEVWFVSQNTERHNQQISA